MIGTWPVGKVDTDFLVNYILDQLRVDGYDQVVMFVEYESKERPSSHMMYWLVCTDPDGEWYWLNDPEDSAWSSPNLSSVRELPITDRNITLMVSH